MSDRIEDNGSVGMGRFSLARGLGMLFIIGGHSAADYLRVHTPAMAEVPTGIFAHAGAVFGGGVMAMFFMISGYSFFRRSPGRCFRNQRKLLLYPYMIVAAAVLITKFLLALIKHRSFMENGGEMVLTYLLGLNGFGGAKILGFEVDAISILWFILALFWGWIIYNGILQLEDSRLRNALVGICVVAGWALTCITRIWVYAFPMGLLTVGYLAAGQWIRRRGWLETGCPMWITLAAIILSLVCMAWGHVNIAECIWGLGLVDVAGSYALGFLLMRFFYWVGSRIPSGRLTDAIEMAGFYSMWILCLHAYEKVILPWYRLAEVWPYDVVSYSLICLLLRCLLIYGMFCVIRPMFRWLRRSVRRR